MRNVEPRNSEKEIRHLINSNIDVKNMVKNVEEAFNSMLANTFEWSIAGWFKRIKFSIAPDNSFNASAYCGLFNRIEVNIGVMPIIQALAINVSKLEFIWPDIKFDKQFDQQDSLNRVSDIIKACYFQIDNYELDAPYILSLMESESLGSRESLSYFIYKTMLYFLIFHETAHIICKHGKKLGVTNFAELYEDRGDSGSIEVFKWQWAELEADILGIIILSEIYKIYDLPEVTDESMPIDVDRRNTIRSMLFSTGLLFLMFSYKASSIEESRSSQHPNAGLRLMNIFDTLTNYLSEFHGLSKVELKKINNEIAFMLVKLGKLLGIETLISLKGDKKLVNKEIKRMQDAAGDEWIKNSSGIITKTIDSLRIKTPTF